MTLEESATTGAGDGIPSFANFTNTFVLDSTSPLERCLVEVPKALNIDPGRQRRAHQKSNKGCDNCKKRRVKCNDETPCTNCSRRRVHCQRSIQQVTSTLSPSMTTPAIVPTSKRVDAVVNLHHMKLFHHFQTHTVKTLLFTQEVWEHVLHLSFEFDFLMNATLCISARHLAFLQPENATYPTLAANHLNHALSHFRTNLSSTLSSAPLDAFIATSLLLQYAIWTTTDFVSRNANGTPVVDFQKDSIFSFSAGLKQVFLDCVPSALHQPSLFMPLIRQNPWPPLASAAKISAETLATMQDFFSRRRPVCLEMLSTPPLPYLRDHDPIDDRLWQEGAPVPDDAADPRDTGYAAVVTRLCLILSFLPEAQPPERITVDSPLFSDMARIIFSFSIACRGPYADMVAKNDPHALLLLYHFYRAVGVLLPAGQCWWARQRAGVGEEVLREWLSREAVG